MMDIEYTKNQSIHTKHRHRPGCCRRPRPHSWWRRPIYRNPCILIYQNKPVPLNKIKYDVAINGGLANVTLSQEYFNNQHTPINVTYKFPVNDEVVFGGIEAIFRNRRIEGKIKEKNQAKQEFLAHKAQGDTVVYAEQLEQTEDIMKVELGNFPPQEPLTICFKYMVRLDVMNDVNWAFRIPSTLTPRYNPGNDVWDPFHDVPLARRPLYCPRIEKPLYYATQKYTWEINVSVYWPGGLKNIQCISHPNAVIIEKKPGVITMNFNPASGAQFPNKDFEVVIQDTQLFNNSCQVAMSTLPTITGGSPKYAAMMQFIPSMYSWYAKKGVSESEGVDLYADDHNDFLMENTNAEYIFVLDRSGSMRGDRMEKAKRALIFFLKSLPYNSMFNIISFGSNMSPMWPSAQQYNTQNLQIAISKINTFSADLGGTNILHPLQTAFASHRTPNFQRNIFLLTDGAVSNTAQVFNCIESNCVYNSSRVYSIGIGNGCSELLVKRSAKLGNGMSVIVSDNDNVEGKIINLLNASFSPSLTNFNVEFDAKYICAISPMPGPQSHITRGEPFTMYALIKNNIETAPNMTTDIKVSFYDSVSKKQEIRVFTLNLNGCIVDSSFHKICVKKIIEGQKRMIKTHYLDPMLERVPMISTKLAIAYQVLSAEHTAFICVIEKNTNGMFMPSQDVIVPSLQSVDYSDNNGRNGGFAAGGHAVMGARRMMKKCFSGSRGRGGGQPMARTRGAPVQYGMAAPVQSYGTARPGMTNMRSRKRKVNESYDPGMLPQSNAFFGGSNQTPTTRTMRMPTSMRMEEKREMEMDECDQMESISTSNSFQPTNKSGGNQVNQIVLQQQIRGFWVYNQATLNSIGATDAKILHLKAQIKDLNVLMTIILLGYLTKYGDASTIEIIVNKAMGYLRKQNVPQYKSLVENASTLV